MELAPTAREDGCIQRYYQYLILSKPSYRLVLSYAGVSQAGDARRPSSLIGEIRRLFPELVIWEDVYKRQKLFCCSFGQSRFDGVEQNLGSVAGTGFIGNALSLIHISEQKGRRTVKSSLDMNCGMR